MKTSKLLAYLVAALFATAAFSSILSAQTGDGDIAQTGSPVAYVYVSSSPSANKFQINAFAADSKGHLTPVAGSRFPADVQIMALNGKYLFGTNGLDIYTFSIASDGALQQVSSINAQQYNSPGNAGGPYALFLDHTGSTLYDEDIYGNNGANNDYQFFTIDKPTGALSYLGVTTSVSTEYWTPLSFIGNNVYAYGSDCYHLNPDLFGFKRNSDGSLTYLNNNPPMPRAKAGDFFCPYLAAADPTNHVAVPVQALNGSSWQADGAPQVAVYTADASGNLTTSSTYLNMPRTAVQTVTDVAMSPSGKLLAVAGTAGLQVFHFNGANPIRHFTGLLTRDRINNIDQMFWDNANHLYVISGSAGKLFVFTITPTSAVQAPGSPYTITSPVNIIVLPKT